MLDFSCNVASLENEYLTVCRAPECFFLKPRKEHYAEFIKIIIPESFFLHCGCTRRKNFIRVRLLRVGNFQ